MLDVYLNLINITEMSTSLCCCTVTVLVDLHFVALLQENSFKKNLKKKKKVTIKINKGSASQGVVKEEEVEETEANEAKQDQNALKAKSSNINGKHGKLKLKAKVKEETLVSPEYPQNEVTKTPKGTEIETYASKKTIEYCSL